MQQDQELAMRQAQLGAGQGLMYQAASAGQRAGRSIAGLFGVEDPKLKEASARQELKNAISAQWDGQDPVEAYKIMAKEAARLGLTQEAISAAAQVKAAEESKTMGELKRGLLQAQTGQAVSRGKQAEAQALAAGKPKPSDLGALQAERNGLRTRMQNSTNPLEQEELRQQIAEIDNAIAIKTTREAKAAKEPNKVGVSTTGQVVYYDPETRKQFTFDSQGKEVPFTGQIREGGSTTNVVLNTPQTAALVDQGQKATKPIFDRVQSIDRSISLIDQNTPFSEAALRQEIASIFGDSQKAATEIRGLANTGSLDERIANRIVDFVSGKPTKVTNEDRRAVLVALRKREQDQYERRLNPFRQAIKKESGGDPNAIFPSFEEAFGSTPGAATGKRKTKSGTEYTVE
jgi:hypothetical protein